MDIGFISVMNELSQYLTDSTLCYYHDNMLKTDMNGIKATLESVTPSVDGDITKFKITNNEFSILNDFNINLKNKYTVTIDDIYSGINITNHYLDLGEEYIECIKVPTIINDGTYGDIESIALILTSATHFSYGKFPITWKPRGACLFEGLTINIEISVKNDEDRNILDENVQLLLSHLLNRTSITINDSGKIGYFKIIGRPTVSKGTEQGKDNQSTIISFNGYYQINYKV